jgi:hypothetical protein
MEIYLADEQAYHFVPRFTLEVARDRVEQKKTGLVAGTLGSLFSRPDPGDIQLSSIENRLEPYWTISAAARTVFDRTRAFTVPVSGPDVQRVKIFGQEVLVDKKVKEGPAFSLEGVESCLEERRAARSFDGLTGEKFDAEKFKAFPKTVIVDLDSFSSPEAVVIPPQVRAAAVVRQVLAEVIRPVQSAQVIHEETVHVEAIELNFRPVYAFEYEWAAKGKRVVIEFDALTGEMTAGGKKLSAQIKGMVSRDLLFDITADAAGMLVPGGGIAVKLVKAVVDRPKSNQMK